MKIQCKVIILAEAKDKGNTQEIHHSDIDIYQRTADDRDYFKIKYWFEIRKYKKKGSYSDKDILHKSEVYDYPQSPKGYVRFCHFAGVSFAFRADNGEVSIQGNIIKI